MHGTVPPLHALTNDVVLADPAFVATARTVMLDCRSRVAIHLRAVEISARRLLELALELRVIAEETQSWVLVHDRVDIAIVAGITGTQLTSHSLVIADARRIAPAMILGASIHSSAEAWLTAQSGANFLVAGPGGDARDHAHDAAAFVRGIVDAADGCPVIAVGGMTPERVNVAVHAGASGVAAMRGIWLADAARATRRYLAAYDEGLRR